MKKWGILIVVLGLLALAGASTATAQEIKAWWTTSGFFGPTDIKALIPSAPSRMSTFPISMWIIDHPKGLIVYDSGNNVAISDGKCETYWPKGFCQLLQPSQKRDDVIDRQLQKLGYSPEQVKFVITSHAHLDHIGNIKLFPKATHVMQRRELYQAWWPDKFQRGAFILSDYDTTRDFNFLELDGDYDLFGDGSVVVLSTPGHTMGHQSLKLRLKQTGTVLISGDAIWMQENLDGHVPGINFNTADSMRSIERLKQIRDLENGQLFMSHDEASYKKGIHDAPYR
jgi:glyoxylase-like metal-dependent hydrolase (beta-lactamase superfamily II)